MNHKAEQLGAAIDTALRQVLAKGLQDPRVSGLVTVTQVKVTADFSEAHVGISVLPEDRAELAIHGLQAAATHLRREVGKLVQTRSIPFLKFRADNSFKRQASLLNDIDRAKQDLERRDAAKAAAREQEQTQEPPP